MITWNESEKKERAMLDRSRTWIMLKNNRRMSCKDIFHIPFAEGGYT